MSRSRRFFSRWQNWIGLVLILVYVGAAVFAPYLSPNDPNNPGPFLKVGKVTQGEPQPPGEKAVLGMLPLASTFIMLWSGAHVMPCFLA